MPSVSMARASGASRSLTAAGSTLLGQANEPSSSHVSHASRIEPVVEKGEIYATEAFVAFVEIARSNGEHVGFDCDYLGQVDFAKGYGRYPLFRLRDQGGDENFRS